MAIRTRKTGKQPEFSLGRIEKLLVENFKSYAGLHEIGPFDKFTCIIGPNGSGKSNIMDAISFSLGIRAKHLRGERLKDLIYRREEEDVESNTRNAKVTVVFRTAAGEILHFGRAINNRGEGTYRFGPPTDVKSLGYEEFLQCLAGQSIYVKARNFLVFQGDVMELARRQGTDLTGVLETISGSDLLREQYTKLQRELELMEEKARLHFQRRREAEGVVTLLAQQREEVLRWQELRAKRDQLLLEMALFKLYCAQKEAERNKEAGNNTTAELASSEASLKQKRKEVEEAEASRKKKETEAEKARAQLQIVTSRLGEAKEEIRNHRKTAAHWQVKVKEKELLMKEEEDRVKGWEAELAQAQQDLEQAELHLAELQNQQVTSRVKLTSAQRAEYERAKAKADSLNLRARESLKEVTEQLRQTAQELEDHKRETEGLVAKRKRALKQLEELGVETRDLEMEREEAARHLEEKRRQAQQIADEAQQFLVFRDSLLEEQQTLQFQLDSARARRERLEQMESRQRVADELREVFPEGVLGRLSEILLPTQKRFELPIQMSLGGLEQAFVVRDSAAGRQCVEFLKSRRIATETFLPLDRMDAPQAQNLQVLTQGHGKRRLGVSCVKGNEQFFERHPRWMAHGPAAVDQLISFLLSGTVIVDNLEEGKATAFTDARRHRLQPRIVTLDGEVITPNGNMSVQSLGTMARVQFGGAQELQEIRDKEKKLRKVEEDLETLNKETSKKQQRRNVLVEQVGQLETRHMELKLKLDGLDKAHKLQGSLLSMCAEKEEELRPKIERGTAKLKKLEREKATKEAELLKIGMEFFTKLSKDVGVPDIREVMQLEELERRKLREEVEAFEDQVRSLQAEVEQLEKRLRTGSKLEELRRDRDQFLKDAEDAQKRQGDAEQQEKTLANKCEELRRRQEEAARAKDKLEQETSVKKQEVKELRAKVDELQKALKKHNEKVRVLLTLRCQKLRDITEKLVEVPLLSKDDAAWDLVVSRAQDLDDVPFHELEAASEAIVVDFSKLPEAKKEIAAQTRIFDTQGVEGEYQAQIQALNKELEALSPNQRAVDQCAMEESKLRAIRKEAEEASRESTKLLRAFEDVKVERTARFMKCFKHVEARVSPLYKALTSYDGMEGGSAYLDLDDAEEPYNGGITFTACPPGKRFFPMELLSGGEKSMASMALLFAMHSYQPPPFMILDEVDAPFDKKNTNSLVSYLKKLGFQCLVISLKDTFFSHSDSIVGIYKDRESQSSGTLSLPLKRLEKMSAPPREVPLSQALRDTENPED